MSNAIKLLDKFAQTCLHANDSATARALRVTPQTVNNWRHGRSQPNAESIERMCETLGEPLREWLPLIEAERARTPADRRVWLRMAQATAAVALTLGMGLTSAPLYAHGARLAAHNPGTMYIMSTLRKLRKLARLLRFRILSQGTRQCLDTVPA